MRKKCLEYTLKKITLNSKLDCNYLVTKMGLHPILLFNNSIVRYKLYVLHGCLSRRRTSFWSILCVLLRNLRWIPTSNILYVLYVSSSHIVPFIPLILVQIQYLSLHLNNQLTCDPHIRQKHRRYWLLQPNTLPLDIRTKLPINYKRLIYPNIIGLTELSFEVPFNIEYFLHPILTI